MTQLWAVGLALLAAFIGGFSPIFLKKATKSVRFSPLKVITNIPLITGVALAGISIILFTISLKGGEVSILYPLEATGYLWAIIFSKILLKETMTPYKWTGLAFIIIGVSLIGITL